MNLIMDSLFILIKVSFISLLVILIFIPIDKAAGLTKKNKLYYLKEHQKLTLAISLSTFTENLFLIFLCYIISCNFVKFWYSKVLKL